ncbi:MAG: FkbM family methyltransferase [Alphaproteobacteria bacterium]|nr:MAG: FkbM family methyltransferase [Alphaproteobacteria bacterium]
MPDPKIIRLPLDSYNPIVDTRLPSIANLMVRLSLGKQRGLKRIWRKTLRRIYDLLLTVPNPCRYGEIILPQGQIALDLRNTAYINHTIRKNDGGYENDVTYFFNVLAKRANTVYDIGANWGYFTALFATREDFKGGVHAFEISPRTFADLSKLTAACPKKITTHPYGLSDSEGFFPLHEGRHSALSRLDPNATHGTMVKVCRLDDLDLPDPDIVKIDVEGHEAAVFNGGAKRIQRAKPIIVLESWFDAKKSAAMLEPLQLLAAWGYEFYQIAFEHTANGQTYFTRDLEKDGKATALCLIPLPLDTRPLFAEALNVIAIHPQTATRFFS